MQRMYHTRIRSTRYIISLEQRTCPNPNKRRYFIRVRRQRILIEDVPTKQGPLTRTAVRTAAHIGTALTLVQVIMVLTVPITKKKHN